MTIRNCVPVRYLDNIFINMNMKNKNVEKQIAEVHKVLGSSFRIRLLMTIGEKEACVCHLESVMNKRQAYISQHLMVLRDAGILLTRREGKYIFYRVASDDVFQLVKWAAKIGGLRTDDLSQPINKKDRLECVCPKCVEDHKSY